MALARLGTTARITNLRTGACVDGIVGDCGDAASDGCKVAGYGEISYAAARAIGVYEGPEKLNQDQVKIEIGVAAGSSKCQPEMGVGH